MDILKSYACGEWHTGSKPARLLHHAVTGDPIAECSSDGIDLRAMVEWARREGGLALRGLNFVERAGLLKQMAAALNDGRDDLLAATATYGATRADAGMDVDGGIATLGYYASLGKRLPPANLLADGEAERLSKSGGFVGRHVWVSLQGVAVQINAYNFPAWGLLEKLAPAFLAGLPTIVKPATPSALVAVRVVERLLGSGVMPPGSLQLICGSVGSLFEHLTCQDVVSFTGSAATAAHLRTHSTLVANVVRLNVEADSLNFALLGPDASPGSAIFEAFVKEVVREMTGKAGQKCTAIRRVLVPAATEAAVIEAVAARLATVIVGDPAREGVRMGPLVDRDALTAARAGIARLRAEADLVHGDPERAEFEGGSASLGAFLEPVLLRCRHPESATLVHEVEVFGPVATIMAYRDLDQAIDLIRRGQGSLVGSVFSEDEESVRRVTLGVAPFHGRLLVMNAAAAGESTGHGVVMPHLVHGGPGRAGGGEELGGLRGLQRYMLRVAVQGDPASLERLFAPALPAS